jgi:hypothetical protein
VLRLMLIDGTYYTVTLCRHTVCPRLTCVLVTRMRRYADTEVRDVWCDKLQYGHHWTSAYIEAADPVPSISAECELKIIEY